MSGSVLDQLGLWSTHNRVKKPDWTGPQNTRCKCFQHVLLECVKGIVTIIFLDCTPEELNKIEFTVELSSQCNWVHSGIEFTVEFGQENTEMTCSFNNLLYKRFLSQEVRLLCEYCFATAVVIIKRAFLALSVKTSWVKSLLFQDFSHPFWFVWVICMVQQKYHGLLYCQTIFCEPHIMHFCLLPSRSDIHARNYKSILHIHWVALWVVNH